MMEKLPLTLRERQLEYLRILKELDRFCTENGLTYYMGCGTLIGAVRHKGFIPWDDDLDVFIPRPDFLKLVNKYHSKDFSFHTIYNDKSHPYNFGRLCSEDVYSLFRGQPIFNFGIDVYVINGAPSCRDEQLKHMADTFFYINLKVKLERIHKWLIRRRLWPFKRSGSSLLTILLFKAEKKFAKYDFDKCDYIWPYGGGHLNMKKENYGTPVRLQFEDGMFYAPEHYHEVLTMAYGDYMKLPPEDKRHPYHGGSFFRK